MKVRLIFIFFYSVLPFFAMFLGQPLTSNYTVSWIKPLATEVLNKEAQVKFHKCYHRKSGKQFTKWYSLNLEKNDFTDKNWRKLCNTIWSKLAGEEENKACDFRIMRQRKVRLPLVSKKGRFYADVLKCQCTEEFYFYTTSNIINYTEYFILDKFPGIVPKSFIIIQYVTNVSPSFHITTNIPDLNSDPSTPFAH